MNTIKLLTSKKIIPYNTHDKVTSGTDNGVSGAIKEAYYYNSTLSIDEIKSISK